MLLRRITQFINRRRSPKYTGVHLVTWESELRAIAAEASAWSIETGGDLFGRWQDILGVRTHGGADGAYSRLQHGVRARNQNPKRSHSRFSGELRPGAR